MNVKCESFEAKRVGELTRVRLKFFDGSQITCQGPTENFSHTEIEVDGVVTVNCQFEDFNLCEWDDE